MNELVLKSAMEMTQDLAEGIVSSVELLQAHFDRIDALNPKINAIIWQDRASGLEEAGKCDSERASGKLRGPLHGLPMTVKESFDLAGSPTTWGKPVMKDNIASRDADVVARLRQAGAVVFGKTNVPLDLGDWQSFNEIYGSTSNPWDTAHSPGGSSGGSAAALATGMTPLELGSDIGASIRVPAHYCGVFGLKPTWNALSMQGHLPPEWFGDVDIAVAGPMARSAIDLTMAFDVLLGPSRFESSHWAPSMPLDERTRVRDFKVAVKFDDAVAPVEMAYVDALEDFASKLEATGATVVRNQLPQIDSQTHFETYMGLRGAALSAGISDEEIEARWAAVEAAGEAALQVFCPSIKGMGMSHREWLVMDNNRRKARLEFDRFFEEFDIILTPVSSSPAIIKDETTPVIERKELINGQSTVGAQQAFWTAYSNVVGLPSVVGPIDFIGELPVGYHAIAGHGRDRTALAFAAAVENEIKGFQAPPLAV